MKVAILGDIHGGTRYLDWGLEMAVASGAEMMIQVGDFGFGFDDDLMDKVTEITDKHKIPLWAIRGNHDDPALFSQHVQGACFSIIPDGFVTTIGSKRVAFLGGAVSIDREFRDEHIDWWKDERVSPHIVNNWMYNQVKADVLISHEAPLIPANLNGFKLPPRIERDCEEDRHLVHMAAEILEPDVIYHGHYHKRYTSHIHLYSKKTLIEGLNCDGNPLSQSMIIRDF